MAGADVDVDPGGDAQPTAPLDAGLGREVLALGALDGRLGQHRVTEEPAAARSDTAEAPAEVEHPREAQVVTGTPGDPRDVTPAGLVEGDRVGPRFADPGRRLLDHRRVGDLAVAAGQTGQAE